MANDFTEKLRSLGYLSGGRSRDRVREGRRPDGVRYKAVTDQLGNTVTEHNTPEDRVDVTIRPEPVHLQMEVR